MTTRGERNKNPTNIDYSPTVNWQGQTGIETGVPSPRFAVFSDVKWGIRAAARQLLTYQSQHGLRTVRGLINRWAPPGENNTGAYVAAVAAGVGVGPDDEIDVDTAAIMLPLVRSVIVHENGENPYTDAQITEAIRLAGVADAPPPKLTTQKTFQAQVGGAVALAGAGATQLAQYAPSVKSAADKLSDYTGSPIIQHAVTFLLTVAGGLTLVGIAAAFLKQRSA